MDSSLSNTGFISVSRSDSVVLICVIVLRTALRCVVFFCGQVGESKTLRRLCTQPNPY